MSNEILKLTRELKEDGDSEISLTIPMEILKTALLGNLSGNEFKMFIAIATFMDDRGECTPSQETLSVLTGMAIATTNTAINALLKKKIGDSPILLRELVGKGSSKYSQYRIPNPNEQHTITETSSDKKPMTSPEIMKLFREKYQEKYGVPYKPDYRREMGMIKKALLPNYTDEQIVIMIETVFEEFDKRWKQPQYPAPTIGAICSWLGGQALKLSADRVKAKTSVSKWDDLENTDEDLML